MDSVRSVSKRTHPCAHPCHQMQRSTLLLSLIAFACLSAVKADDRVTSADVVVYGATSGGVIAAVESARLGRKTILIEPGKRIGGMSSSGLGWTDNGSTETIGGLSREFYQRIYQFYTKPENWRFQKR